MNNNIIYYNYIEEILNECIEDNEIELNPDTEYEYTKEKQNDNSNVNVQYFNKYYQEYLKEEVKEQNIQYKTPIKYNYFINENIKLKPSSPYFLNNKLK